MDPQERKIILCLCKEHVKDLHCKYLDQVYHDSTEFQRHHKLWWMSLSVTRVVNPLLCSDELYFPFNQSVVAIAGATNAVNMRQTEAVTVPLFFLPFHFHTINPTIPTHGYFVLFQFGSHQETKMGAIKLHNQYLWSHRKIWDCKQSIIHINWITNYTFTIWW